MTFKIPNLGIDSFEDSFSGKCPKFDKTATVTIRSVGRQMCKTDLQLTYHRVGLKCSLLKNTFSPCMDNCPLVPEKYL